MCSAKLTGDCNPNGIAMRNYDRINALPPKGIDKKSAHIIGGGVAGFGNHTLGLDAKSGVAGMADTPGYRDRDAENMPVAGGVAARGATGRLMAGLVLPVVLIALVVCTGIDQQMHVTSAR